MRVIKRDIGHFILQARIFTLQEKSGIISRRERFHQNFQEFLVDDRGFLPARKANNALSVFSKKIEVETSPYDVPLIPHR